MLQHIPSTEACLYKVTYTFRLIQISLTSHSVINLVYNMLHCIKRSLQLFKFAAKEVYCASHFVVKAVYYASHTVVKAVYYVSDVL